MPALLPKIRPMCSACSCITCSPDAAPFNKNREGAAPGHFLLSISSQPFPAKALRPVWSHFPVWKTTAREQPPACLRPWGKRWIPSLPMRYSGRNTLGRNVWVFWPYLCLWIHPVTHGDAILVISIETQVKIALMFFWWPDVLCSTTIYCITPLLILPLTSSWNKM